MFCMCRTQFLTELVSSPLPSPERQRQHARLVVTTQRCKHRTRFIMILGWFFFHVFYSLSPALLRRTSQTLQ
ncbi:hypothetical protein GOODEAATRI_014679 [Goodea atripinnis]|uniref:Uncharacterized protein n=1 Tax=Goodea atripinnis TaxID=208336 RepID=A0ABV0NKB6_9TELE